MNKGDQYLDILNDHIDELEKAIFMVKERNNKKYFDLRLNELVQKKLSCKEINE